jgi:hypothetical protein
MTSQQNQCGGVLRAGSTNELKPIKTARSETEAVRAFTDPRKLGVTNQLDRSSPTKLLEVQDHRQYGTGEVVDHQECFFSILPNIRQNPLVRGIKELYRAAPKGQMLFAHSNESPQPVQYGGFSALLSANVRTCSS